MPFFLAPGQKQVNQLLLGATAVADPEEGPGGPGSPLIFKPNWGPKGGKKIFWDQDPLFQGLDDRPPPRPLIWKSGSAIGLWYPGEMENTVRQNLRGGGGVGGANQVYYGQCEGNELHLSFSTESA